MDQSLHAEFRTLDNALSTRRVSTGWSSPFSSKLRWTTTAIACFAWIACTGALSAQQIIVNAYGSSYVAPANYSVISSTPYAAPTASVVTASAIPSDAWGQRVTNALNTLSPDQLPRIETAKANLSQAIQELDSFLSTAPNYRDQWLSFLRRESIDRELNAAEPNLDNVVQLEKNFRQNYRGLELAPFTKVRDALKSYTYAIRFGADRTKSTEILKNRLTRLSELLQQANRDQDPEVIRDIAQTVAYLSQSNQATSLKNDIQSQYARPNARVLLSIDFLNRRFSRPVSQATPVNEEILGTHLIGNSQIDGWVKPQLLDSPSQAKLRLQMNANFASNNTGYNRGVKLYTQGAANIVAGETMALSSRGFSLQNDPYAVAALTSHINSIEAKLPIIERLAAKRAAKQKPLADSIARGRLESRIRNQFHEQLGQQLVEANSRLDQPEAVELRRLGLKRPEQKSWSSAHYLAMLWHVGEGSQLTAPSSCPLIVDPTGVTVQLHQSAVANMIDPILAGRTVRNTDMAGFTEQFGDSGLQMREGQNEEPWSISMASFHPIEVTFADSLITLRIRTTKLDRGDQSLDQTASIEASYRVVLVDGALQLERVGDVRIEFTGKQQRGVRAVSLRSFMKKKFEEVFREKLLDAPVRITERLPGDLQGLQLASVEVEKGWLQAHVR